MCTDCLQRICEMTGLIWNIERFDYEAELLEMHPEWVDPIDLLAIEHPREESAREWGMALWRGLLIAAASSGSVGMALVFATPFGSVLGVVGILGLVLAGAFGLLARVHWRRRLAHSGIK